MHVTCEHACIYKVSSQWQVDIYLVWPNIDTWLYVYSYDQALASAQLGQQKMQQLGVAVKRPDDYFAEMIKTDDHMRKV